MKQNYFLGLSESLTIKSELLRAFPLSKRRERSYVLVFISWPMVLPSLVERGISMIVVRRSISTIGPSGRGLSISVLRRGIGDGA